MKSDAIHIGFDLDGVLIDHAQVKVDLAAQAGVLVPIERTAAAFLKTHFSDVEDYRALQKRLYDDPVISLRSPVMEGARATLAAVRNAGMRYTLVSRRADDDGAMRLLEHHLLRPRYFDDDNTYFVREKADKNHIARKVGITHYIDDDVSVLEHLLDVPNRYLMDPYGQYASTGEYTVVRSHRQFLEALGLA